MEWGFDIFSFLRGYGGSVGWVEIILHFFLIYFLKLTNILMEVKSNKKAGKPLLKHYFYSEKAIRLVRVAFSLFDFCLEFFHAFVSEKNYYLFAKT